MQLGSSLGLPVLPVSSAIFDRVFVAVDFSSASRRAVLAALELRDAFGSAVCLFHQAELDASDEFLAGLGSPAVMNDLVAEATGRLARWLSNVAPGRSERVELRARRGMTPIEDLHREARAWGATVLIAAANVHSMILRSPAEKIIHRFDVPVLLVPESAPAP